MWTSRIRKTEFLDPFYLKLGQGRVFILDGLYSGQISCPYFKKSAEPDPRIGSPFENNIPKVPEPKQTRGLESWTGTVFPENQQ